MEASQDQKTAMIERFSREMIEHGFAVAIIAGVTEDYTAGLSVRTGLVATSHLRVAHSLVGQVQAAALRQIELSTGAIEKRTVLGEEGIKA